MNESSDLNAFIFWVHRWDNVLTAVNRLNPHYTLCEVEADSIRLQSSRDYLTISIEDIVNCTDRIYSRAQYDGLNYRVELTLKEDVKLTRGKITDNKLYITPIDPLGFLPSYDETYALIELINALRFKTEISMHRNPYQRALVRKKRGSEFSEEKWDALTPPSEFFPPPGFWGAAKVTALVTMAFVLMFLLALCVPAS